MSSSIIIYQSAENKAEIEVRLNEETVWLSLNQMADLFKKAKSTISEHIKNVYSEGELELISTVRNFRTVQKEGKRNIERDIEYYNLDVIISVGYRVKSKEGTQFRIWANRVLKEYLVQGYALNKRILETQKDKLNKLNDAIKLFSGLSLSDEIDAISKSDFLSILDKYSSALIILDNYDYQRLNDSKSEYEQSYILEYGEVIEIIEEMKAISGNSELFGRQKDDSLKSSISSIYQTYGGKDLYPTIIDKATNLLYFIVKNHSFVDGNKRIAAALFLYFLNKNDKLEKINLDNNLLASLTLLIANSKLQERELIINIVSVMLSGKE